MEALEALAAGRRATSPSTHSRMKRINALNLDPGPGPGRARRSGTTAEAAERCYECGRACRVTVRTFCSPACCVAYSNSTAKTGVGSEGTPIAKASAGASTPNTPGASTPSTRGPRVIDDTKKNDEKDIFQLLNQALGVDFVPQRINAPNLDLASDTTAKAARTTAEAAERRCECGRACRVRTFCCQASCVAYSTAKTEVGSEGTPIAKASAGASTPSTPGASTPSYWQYARASRHRRYEEECH